MVREVVAEVALKVIFHVSEYVCLEVPEVKTIAIINLSVVNQRY